MTLLRDALHWHQLGATPIPVRPDGTKAPAVTRWRDWQDRQPELGEVITAFQADHDGLGLICGQSSGGLELLELEGRAVDAGLVDQLQQVFADHGMAELWQRIDTGYSEQTPGGGIHWYYRVDGAPVTGNTRLARDSEKRVLIETRGQGGFTVIAPSAGRTHPTGKAYTVRTGSPETIANLSADEYAAVHVIAGLLDQAPTAEPDAGPTTRPRQPGDPLRPGDDFNARATWEEILTPHGWTLHARIGQSATWRKPGKRRPGISATTGRAADADRLFVFSTSTDFEPERAYAKFSAYAVLNHGGDHSAAAKALREAGYGDQADQSENQLLGLIVSNPTPEQYSEGTTALKIEQAGSDIPRAVHASLTDQGNADVLAELHHDKLRYVPARGLWLRWDGTRWAWCDDNGEAITLAVATLRGIKTDDSEVRKHIARSLSKRGLEAMVTLASKHPALRVSLDDLDCDPWLLNTPDGLVDLRTGLVRASKPDDFCTRSAAVAPGRGQPTQWLAFLEQTFGDDELARYIQRLAGYSACGQVTHHILPFLHGGGGNGKSVFLDVIVALLGDYASTAPPNFLMAGRQDESAIARLAGLRLVACSEVSQSARFDEAKVKLLTGGDRLTARFLYGRHFTFQPTAKLWLMGNHQPRVEAGGESFWRRLRLVPFTRTVPKERRVEGLAQQLIDTEGPQILQWIIDGCQDMLSGGLADPEVVLAATRTYAEEEDALSRFVSERLHIGGGDIAREPTAAVRAAYLSWCRDEGEIEANPTVFGREMKSRWGIRTVRSHGKRYYVGLTLLADADEPESEAWW